MCAHTCTHACVCVFEIICNNSLNVQSPANSDTHTHTPEPTYSRAHAFYTHHMRNIKRKRDTSASANIYTCGRTENAPTKHNKTTSLCTRIGQALVPRCAAHNHSDTQHKTHSHSRTQTRLGVRVRACVRAIGSANRFMHAACVASSIDPPLPSSTSRALATSNATSNANVFTYYVFGWRHAAVGMKMHSLAWTRDTKPTRMRMCHVHLNHWHFGWEGLTNCEWNSRMALCSKIVS